MTVEELFLAATEKDTPAERAAYLDAACGPDTGLRAQVEGLLRAHAEAGSVLDQPLFLSTPTGAAPGAGGADDTLDFLAPADKPGSLGRLGHYEVLEVIGRGGMGIVLRAFDEKLRRIVAIKVLAPLLAGNAMARKRFVREAQAAAAVRNEHVIGIHAVEEAGPVPYLVMEYIAGVSLQQRLERTGPLQQKEILRIGLQAATGLAAAHAQGLVHRDIKPANILLENHVERVKISDFGLARAADDAHLTNTGVVAGTPQYMAPEQAKGDPVDQRGDLFSLGSVLYALCTGRPPFRASTTMGVLRRVCEDTPRPIREINPDVPPWLAAIITRLMAKEPAGRYQSAAEVAEVLGRRLAELQQPAGGLEPTEPLAPLQEFRPGGGRTRRWAAAAAVLLVLLAGLAASEATGFTRVAQYVATVLRIRTPDGTLVVEVNDPEVKITIEGDGGLVINGAGPQEFRLAPGTYKVLASKDGKPVQSELVTISRGDKQVVKVSRERPQDVTVVPAAQSGQGPFVVLASDGQAERHFVTLAEAVAAARSRDTIEIRGNGPFLVEPIRLLMPLTIRAGPGFRPILRGVGTEEKTALLLSNTVLDASATLVLEGLEFQGPEARSVLAVHMHSGNYFGGLLFVANCRFSKSSLMHQNGTVCQVRNCQFRSRQESAVVLNNGLPGFRGLFDNNVITVGSGINCVVTASDMSLELTRNLILSSSVVLSSSPRPRVEGKPPPRLQVQASQNILVAPVTLFNFSRFGPITPAAADDPLRQEVAWHEERNLYPTGVVFFHRMVEPDQPTRNVRTVAEWNQFWGLKDTGSVQGRILLERGEPGSFADADRLEPAEFRLKAGSAGKGAGKDGQDLGPDVELVGPGPAYEHWKKTPAYKQWLKDTGQHE